MSQRQISQRPLRTVVWSTGGVGSIAIDAMRRRPDLELVGVWVHSPDKVGKDAGELADGAPMGVRPPTTPTRSSRLSPDCVVYAASGPERDAAAVPDYVRAAGGGHQRRVDVVHQPGVSRLRTTRRTGASQLEAAAKAGNASFYVVRHLPGLRLRPARAAA